MKDFTYYAPTEVVFGKNSEEKIGKLVRKYGGTKVLVHYGGQSAIKSGLLDKTCKLLEEEGIPYVKLGGVVPNPRVSLVREGIELCKRVLTGTDDHEEAESFRGKVFYGAQRKPGTFIREDGKRFNVCYIPETIHAREKKPQVIK